MIHFETLDGLFFTLYDPFTMEHPIPQNVTSFEFHLVGDMTLKQFGYLAAGLVTAYITFIVLFPRIPLLAVPIIGFSVLAGVSFAFLPILDRPLDHWLVAFLKSVYSPTKASWRSPSGTKEKISAQDGYVKNRLQVYLSALNATPIIPNISPALQQPAAPLITQEEKHLPKDLPSSEELNRLVAMGQQSHILQTQIAETKKQISQLETAMANPQATPPQTDAFQKAVGNLENLVKETNNLYKQSSTVAHPKTPSTVMVSPLQPAAKTQISLTTSPNIINGIVTDVAGTYLEGVIVIIHNKDSLPVRALKTNKLGQFAGATPLPSGIYNITLEKDNLEFGTIQVTLNGSVMPPLQIASRRVGSL